VATYEEAEDQSALAGAQVGGGRRVVDVLRIEANDDGKGESGQDGVPDKEGLAADAIDLAGPEGGRHVGPHEPDGVDDERKGAGHSRSCVDDRAAGKARQVLLAWAWHRLLVGDDLNTADLVVEGDQGSDPRTALVAGHHGPPAGREAFVKLDLLLALKVLLATALEIRG
jgi:hypothetical protein